MTQLSLEELAGVLQGDASESPGPVISGARPLEHAQKSDITYVLGQAFLSKLSASSAGAVIIPSDVEYSGLPCIRLEPGSRFCQAYRLVHILIRFRFEGFPPKLRSTPRLDRRRFP